MDSIPRWGGARAAMIIIIINDSPVRPRPARASTHQERKTRLNSQVQI